MFMLELFFLNDKQFQLYIDFIIILWIGLIDEVIFLVLLHLFSFNQGRKKGLNFMIKVIHYSW